MDRRVTAVQAASNKKESCFKGEVWSFLFIGHEYKVIKETKAVLFWKFASGYVENQKAEF